MKKAVSVLLAMVLTCSFFAGCDSQAGKTDSPETGKTEIVSAEEKKETSYYPIEVKSLDKTFSYTKAPEKVVALDYISAQILVALGLEDKIVALAPSMNTIDEVKDEYRTAISAIKMFPEDKMNKGVPGFESVLEAGPDLVVGTAYAFNANNVGDIQDFIENKINIYASEGTYVEKPTLENVYNDIQNLGKIFNVSDKAEKLIADLRAREKKIADALKETKEATVFNFDTNMNDGTFYTVGGANLLDSLFAMANVKNIFGDLGENYARISLEEIISRNPEYILVTKYYKENDAKEKIDYLKSTPELADVTAVKKEQYIIVSGICLRPGLQTLDALEEIVKTIHPEIAK